jgi:hypothetical protein
MNVVIQLGRKRQLKALIVLDPESMPKGEEKRRGEKGKQRFAPD